jgi:metacaspase-1
MNDDKSGHLMHGTCPVPTQRYPDGIMRVDLASLVVTSALLASSAGAEVRAVLVGVGDYLTLDADLKGPANDVRLMAETLAARGVDPGRMTVLSTDSTGLPKGTLTARPLRAEILAALDAAAGASAAGDTLVFYYSGHGAQAPDMSGDEGGGYDEILLPADAAGWKGAIGAVENAILDDELQHWAQAALSRGVKVVGLIDACHSATGFRAVGGEGVARVIDETALGIPDDVVPVPGNPVPPLTGEFVFLYSSQSDQRSFEYPLADGTTWHGEFTLRLAQTLRDAPEASWSQVLAATTGAMVQGPARQMPEGEGTMLDALVFGQGSSAARMPVSGGMLAAGLLQGLSKGAEMAVYADPSGGEPLAVLTLGEVEAREARFAGQLPQGAAWAELVSAPPPDPLTLATPVRADTADGHDYSPWLAALSAGGPGADLVPILTGGFVALARADGVLDPEGPGSSPRIVAEPGETPADAVARVLSQAAHGLRLRAVLAGATGRSLTGKAPITMTIERRAAADTCGKVAEAAAFDPAEGVAPCDQLWLTLTNTGGKAQDVSVLYFAVDFEVQPIWPTQNLANRLATGESARVGLMIEEGSGAGLEEIWVLAVPVDPDAPRVDLTRLATPQMTRAYAGASDPMTLWLEGRMDSDSVSRGFTLKPAPLSMIRQLVRLEPGDNDPAFAVEN